MVIPYEGDRGKQLGRFHIPEDVDQRRIIESLLILLGSGVPTERRQSESQTRSIEIPDIKHLHEPAQSCPLIKFA